MTYGLAVYFGGSDSAFDIGVDSGIFGLEERNCRVACLEMHSGLPDGSGFKKLDGISREVSERLG